MYVLPSSLSEPVTLPRTCHTRRTQQVISDNDKTPLLSQKPAPGRLLQLRLHVPPTMDDAGTKSFTAEEIVTHVDNANFRFAWRFQTPARWLLTAERWQVLRDGGPGQSQKIIYETWEFYGGLLAYLLWFFMNTKLQNSFDAMSRALKDRAERAERE
jgi:hypothetical protein